MLKLLATLIFTPILASSQSTVDPGLKALQEGDYRGAEEYYRSQLTGTIKSPEILSNLGFALEMQGKSTPAIQVFEAALRIRHMPRTYALLAAEKCKTRDLDGARPMLSSIMRGPSPDPSILASIAPCFSEIDEPVQSIRVYEALLAYHGFPSDLALIQLSRYYLKAAQLFLGRLSPLPDSAPYLIAIRNAQKSGSLNARGAFDVAATSSPYFRSDLDFSTVVARLEAHPQDAALLYLASVLSGEQSVHQIEVCEEKYPDSPYLTQLKAEMLADQGHEGEAITLYESLVEKHPELPNLLFDLGMLFRHDRQWEMALNAFQKQLERHPDDERTAARVSEALHELGRWKELSDFLTARIAVRVPPLWAMLDGAEAADNLDDRERAIRILAKAEQLHAADKVVHYRLARLYRASGNAAQATKEMQLFRDLSKK